MQSRLYTRGLKCLIRSIGSRIHTATGRKIEKSRKLSTRSSRTGRTCATYVYLHPLLVHRSSCLYLQPHEVECYRHDRRYGFYLDKEGNLRPRRLDCQLEPTTSTGIFRDGAPDLERTLLERPITDNDDDRFDIRCNGNPVPRVDDRRDHEWIEPSADDHDIASLFAIDDGMPAF